MIDNVKVSEPFSSSDHSIITLDLLYDSHISTWKEHYFHDRRGNYKEMDKSRQSVDWDALLFDSYGIEKWVVFIEVLSSSASNFVPRGKGGLDENNYGGQEALNRPGSWRKKCGISIRHTKNNYTYYDDNIVLSNATKAIRRSTKFLKKSIHLLIMI